MPRQLTDNQIDILQHYIIRLYSTSPSSIPTTLTTERISHFERSIDCDLRKVPMSRGGLVQHAKRSCYQAGFLWQDCLENVTPPQPTQWGWKRSEGKLVPSWQIEEAFDISTVISSCSCKINACKNCKCYKNKTACLPFCSCRRTCGNI